MSRTDLRLKVALFYGVLFALLLLARQAGPVFGGGGRLPPFLAGLVATGSIDLDVLIKMGMLGLVARARGQLVAAVVIPYWSIAALGAGLAGLARSLGLATDLAPPVQAAVLAAAGIAVSGLAARALFRRREVPVGPAPSRTWELAKWIYYAGCADSLIVYTAAAARLPGPVAVLLFMAGGTALLAIWTGVLALSWRRSQELFSFEMEQTLLGATPLIGFFYGLIWLAGAVWTLASA